MTHHNSIWYYIVQVINLSDNTFGEEGSSAIANILPDLQKLQVINFGECLVRSEGAIALATALMDGHPLLEVRSF